MIGTTQVRGYRYPYPQSGRLQSLLGADWLRSFVLTGKQRASLLVVAACAGCIGTANVFALHARAVAAQQSLQEVQKAYAALDSEHVQLLATRAQLSSRERIAKVAETRLQLFEPVAGQVQRM